MQHGFEQPAHCAQLQKVVSQAERNANCCAENKNIAGFDNVSKPTSAANVAIASSAMHGDAMHGDANAQ